MLDAEQTLVEALGLEEEGEELSEETDSRTARCGPASAKIRTLPQSRVVFKSYWNRSRDIALGKAACLWGSVS
jgi:hypothetical protein